MALRWSLVTTAATLSLVVCALASTARATVTFREDFETGTLGKFAGKSNPAGRVTVVMKGAEVVDQGKYAVKVTMQGDERFNAQQLRVQLASINVNVVAGTDTFMSVYMYVKEPPKTRDNFYYYEGDGNGNVMTWWLEPSPDGGTVMKYGTGNLGMKGLHWTGNFEVGKWHQLAAQMHWGPTDQTGNIKLWFDGVQVLDKMVQTMVGPGRYYSEPGIHRDMTRTGASLVGVDSIYFDNFVTADKLAEIELMTPAPGAADGGTSTPDAAAAADAAVKDAATPTPGTGGTSGSGGSTMPPAETNTGGRSGSGGSGSGGREATGGAVSVPTGGATGGSQASGGSSSGGDQTSSAPSCNIGSGGATSASAPIAMLLGLLAVARRRRR